MREPAPTRARGFLLTTKPQRNTVAESSGLKTLDRLALDFMCRPRATLLTHARAAMSGGGSLKSSRIDVASSCSIGCHCNGGGEWSSCGRGRGGVKNLSYLASLHTLTACTMNSRERHGNQFGIGNASDCSICFERVHALPSMIAFGFECRDTQMLQLQWQFVDPIQHQQHAAEPNEE